MSVTRADDLSAGEGSVPQGNRGIRRRTTATLLATRSINKPGPKGEPSAEQVGVAFAKQMNIAGDDAAALAALRQLPATRLVNGMNLMKQQPETYAGPMLDGKIVVEDVEAAFKAGRQARIPFMIGANGLEFGFAPVPPNRTDEILAQFGADREKALAAYDPKQTGNKGVIGMELSSDLAMVEPARMLARATAAAGQPTYQYRFWYVGQLAARQGRRCPSRDRDSVRLQYRTR